jgi:hypothetical protein
MIVKAMTEFKFYFAIEIFFYFCSRKFQNAETWVDIILVCFHLQHCWVLSLICSEAE